MGAFVDGSANFLRALSIPSATAIAIMGVLVASFAGTTLDTACRLQRYVVQELAATFVHTGRGESTDQGISINPLTWLTNKHGATIFAVVLALIIAALPGPGTPVTLGQAIRGEIPADYVAANGSLSDTATSGGIAGAGWWTSQFAGKGGLILWPLFGATNQLLAGLAFLVISFFLWRRNIPVWFIVIPMIFMLIMPAWAMLSELPAWLRAENPNWVVIGVGIATLVLEAWMLIEAAILWPKVRGIMEAPATGVTQTATGPNY